MKRIISQARIVVSSLIALTCGLTSGYAMPPHPGGSGSDAAPKVQESYYVQHLDELHARGVCSADDFFLNNTAAKLTDGKAPAITGPFRVLAILVEFSDDTNKVAATYFDSLVFGTTGSTVKNYFSEVSYTQLDLLTVNLPSALGWRTAPQTYAYYVGGAQGLGSYPNNSQKLVEDLVDQVDPVVNFANYDNDGDGYVDVLLVIHAGTGAEFSGSANDIWSHKWAISPRSKDGKFISDYTVQPEYWQNPGDMTIGVYSHELSHGFGLPDLYDTDNSSYGVGRWCIMGYGSWNGPGGMGGSPSHPCAWSRAQMGFVTPTNVAANITGQSIASVESGGPIFRLWTSGALGTEYFLVENRQRTGYDTYLPSAGLLIWHIDDLKTGNAQEWYPGQPGANHSLVALEQADGLFELEHKTDIGDAADPFPGSGSVTAFNAVSTPNSNSYLSGNSFVAVSNISASAPTMQADLIVGLAAGANDPPDQLPISIDLSQNYPNPFNPSTQIEFSLSDSGPARLEIFNLLGQKVRTLVDGRELSGGSTVVWDGTTDAGTEVSSGVYMYRLTVGDRSMVRKMMLVR
ncbi:MAG: M6 family metalloprotease domain-containing protein [Candidatus Zixiibacteriota bacterium]